MAYSRRWSMFPSCMFRASLCSLFALVVAAASFPLAAQDSSVAGSATSDQQAILASFPKLRDLDTHCPFTPPKSREAWEPRAAELREQLLVSLGLWPMPKLDPVEPKIYGRIPLDGYTIEKVTFESLPGFFVTGNLYRPDPMPVGQKVPAILCPHGHWESARFYDEKPQAIKQLLATGAERFENAARNHIQARCVQLARMGCVVFHWDMLGYCDSTQISFDRAHKFAKQDKTLEANDKGWLLFSPEAEANSQSVMGLQTLIGIRSVDFLLSLPEVDKDRIGITGASGGGTQSFITAAVDPRIAVAFPAVMVSTGMQGGCTCENACSTRTGTGNVEMAALIAPRPLGLTAANDWTKTMPEDGFPELQKVYELFKAKDKVALFPAIHFGHNYNHVARTSMYGWMNKHFGLKLSEPVLERDFEWKGKEDLHVWDAEHPKPESGEEFERKLLKGFHDNVEEQLVALLSPGKSAEFVKTLTTGWKVALGMTTGAIEPAVATEKGSNTWELTSPSDGKWSVKLGDVASPKLTIVATAKSGKEAKRYSVALVGEAWNDKGEVVTIAEQPLVRNPRLAAAYTYCYNVPMIARQARQLAATVAWLHAKSPEDTLTIEGTEMGAGVAAAATFDLTQTAPAWSKSVQLKITPAGFRFAKAESIRALSFLPGSARFLDLPGLVSCLPQSTTISGGDTSDFAKYKGIVEGQGGSLKIVAKP